jgi:hypothetical protein
VAGEHAVEPLAVLIGGNDQIPNRIRRVRCHPRIGAGLNRSERTPATPQR